jgi:hypothetical protein
VRSLYSYIIVAGMFVGWKVVEWIYPPLSGLMFFFFLLAVFLKFVELESYMGTHRLYAPGQNTTLGSPKPSATVPVSLPDEKGVVQTRDFVIYKRHGTHWFGSKSGGGKDHGYVVCPADYVTVMDGEEANVIINCDLELYRQNPDPSRGEIDIEYLNGQVLTELRQLDGWDERSPVFFGWLPWQGDFKKKEYQMELAGINKILEKNNKQLSTELDNALKRLTRYSKVDRHRRDTYDQPQQRPYERYGRERDEEGID